MNEQELKAAAERAAKSIAENGHFSSRIPVPFTPVELVENAEEADARGRKWRVDIITAGLSLNDFYYDEALLSQSVDTFEGAQVFANHDRRKILETGERDIEKIIGWIDNVSYSVEAKALQGDLNLFKTATKIISNLVEAWDAGKRDLMGLSIFATANAVPDVMEGRNIQRVVQFLDGNSVDIVWEPSAGGRFREILESVQEGMTMTPEEKAAQEAAAKKAAEAKKKEQQQVLTVEAATKMAKDAAEAAAKETKETLMAEIRDLRAAHAADNVKNLLERTISESKLPKTVTDKIRESLGDEYTEEQIKEQFEIAESIWSDALTSRKPVKVEVTEDQVEKWQKSFDRMMLGTDLYDPEQDKDLADVKPFQSLGHAFRVIEGITDHYVDPFEVLMKSAQFRNKNSGDRWVTEALSYSNVADRTQWGEIMGDSITRAMIRAYMIPELHQWRPLISDMTSISDFRTQRRIRMGGYGTLPTVAEAENYEALRTPEDEETTYSIEKRGGTEKLTFESIATDDLGTVMRIPRLLGRAAAYTLRNYVFDFLQHGFANTVVVSTTTAGAAIQTSSDEVTVPTPGTQGVRVGDTLVAGNNFGTSIGTVESIGEYGATNTVITLVANAAAAVANNAAIRFQRANTALQTGYDSTDIYHADHRNLGTAALSHAALRDAVVAMRSQVAYGEHELTLSTRPKYLVVPNELEDIAYKLLASSVSFGANTLSFQDENRTTPNIFASSRYGMELIVVDYWLDPNNWFLFADPRMIPTIELGFFQGRQEPELFVQDSPVSDIYFQSDEIQYKIRHIYNGAVLDHRGMYASKVA